LRATTEKHVK